MIQSIAHRFSHLSLFAAPVARVFSFLFPVLFLVILSATYAVAKEDINTEKFSKDQLREVYGKLPLYFISNDGQMNDRVKFYEKGNGHTVYFTKEGVYISLINQRKVTGSSGQAVDNNDGGERVLAGNQSVPMTPSPLMGEGQGAIPPFNKGGQGGINSEVVKLTFLNANPNPEIVAEGIQEGKVNYFLNNDPKKWKTNVPSYKAVLYKEVYPGIDIKFYGNNQLIEYDIIVSPGADPASVQFAYEGTDGLKVTEGGDLEIALKHGSITQKKPVIYQEIEGKRVKVDGRFKILETTPSSMNQNTEHVIVSGEKGTDEVDVNNVFAYTFEVASYDREYPLIIDPILFFSTYLGGYIHDEFEGIAVDNAGNCYVTGSSVSPDFPTTAGAYNTTFNGSNTAIDGGDVVVVKINTISPALSYSTYIGGSDGEMGYDIAVDSFGNAYVTGWTWSTDFPVTAGAFDTSYNSVVISDGDVFVVKLDATGSSLSYSTYIGGIDSEIGSGIAIDSAGNAYVTGGTSSEDFPTTSGAYDRTRNGHYYGDAFVVKLNPIGSSLSYSTYLGGSGSQSAGKDIAVGGAGNAYVTGLTESTDFPVTAGAFDTSYNGVGISGGDVFVVKLDATGTSLSYSTYLGGDSVEYGYGITLDGGGNAYVTGETYSDNFPTTSGAYDTSYNGNGDAFIVKLSSTGASLSYATYLGGLDGIESGESIALDNNGNTWIAGSTGSMDFPNTIDAVDSTFTSQSNDPTEAFAAKLDTTGSSLLYATYLGEIGTDKGKGIAVDRDGNIYVTGWTDAVDFPITLGAYDTDCLNCDQGRREGFLAKLTFPNEVTIDSGNQQSPAVAYNDVDGEYLVLWQDFKNGSSNPDIYGDRLDMDGSVNVSKLPIVTNSAKQAGPAVAYGGGGYMAVWIDQRNSATTGTDVYGAWISRTGTVQSEFVVTNATANQRAASVVYDPAANYFLVTWIDDRNGSGNIDIYGALVPPGAGSSTVIKPFAMLTATGNQRGPYVRYDYGNNQYFMVWFDNRSGNDNVYGSRVSSNGGLLDGTGIEITGASGNQKNPRITDRRPVDGVNNYVVAWIDFRNGSVPDVYGARVNSSGVKVGSDFVISGGSSDQRAISVDIDYLRTKNAMVTWTDNRNGDIDIYGTGVNPANGSVSGDSPIVVTGAWDKRGPLVYYSADFGGVDNGYLLLWRQSNGADQDIYNIKLWP